MGIVFPNAKISGRWNGALQLRLRRAPLEGFLMEHRITPAVVGVTRQSDDLVQATVYLVEAGLARYFEAYEGELVSSQYPFVGYFACEVSYSLSSMILESDAWRIAALVSSARLLSPWIGLTAAAMHSAKIVREFQSAVLESPLRLDAQIRACVAGADSAERAAAVETFCALVARSLTLDKDAQSASPERCAL